MEIIHEYEDKKIVFDESLITAEMYCVANTAFNYFVDLTENSKEDVSVVERVRSGEVSWLFECCSALFRLITNDGKPTKYDVLSHSEMKALLMDLPHTYVATMKSKVEFFFRLPEGSLSKPIMPSKQRRQGEMLEKLALGIIKEQMMSMQKSSSE